MMTIENIQSAINSNKGLMTDDCLYVELDNGEIRELCNITFIDGKLVLRPEIKL